MTVKETLKILAVLRMAYPSFYSKLSREDAVSMAQLWNRMFADDTYPEVDAAVQKLICSESEFPPNIGQVKKEISMLASDFDSGVEAWHQVKKAMRFTNCVENFNSLPELSRRVVGSPNQLKEWAMMDPSVINSVVQSNFLRTYKEVENVHRAMEALPASTRDMIDAIRKGMNIVDGKKDELEAETQFGAVRQLAGARHDSGHQTEGAGAGH